MMRMFLNSASWGLKLNGEGLWISNGILYQEGTGFDEINFIDILSGYPSFILTETEMGFKQILLDDLNEILPLANELFETGMFTWVHPDFMMPIRKNSDPLYASQYFLKNTGQLGGTSGIDINIEPAWAITKGSANIEVAVIDDGLEDHEDLNDTLGNSRILQGYSPGDPGGNGLPVHPTGDVHGEPIAGIIGASHNELGGRGIAPNVLLKGIHPSHSGDSTTIISNYVDAITWAWRSGSDIINNSWTSYVCGDNLIPSLDVAIDSALIYGRGGKGCFVVFSAGWNVGGDTCIRYPASLPQVFTLSSVNNNGVLSHYSPFGPQIDATVPSSDSTSNVTTVDRMGFNGLDSTNYTSGFGGTSTAAAMTSGLAALILSVDSNLTQTQIANLITSTATDMGSVGRNDSTGYGRINAGAALNQVAGTFPVEWSDFYGESQETKVNLTWITSRETNSFQFEVERSYGGGFTNLGTVVAKGFSDTETNYHFIDFEPRFGMNYYRLKQVDLDGKFQYSSTIEVEVEGDNLIQIETRFSENNKDHLELIVLDPKPSILKFRVLDLQGRLMVTKTHQAKSSKEEIIIPLGQVAAGIYFIQVYADGKGVAVRKFTKK